MVSSAPGRNTPSAGSGHMAVDPSSPSWSNSAYYFTSSFISGTNKEELLGLDRQLLRELRQYTISSMFEEEM